MSSHTFRIMQSYQEDEGKTILRMERHEMEKLGIEQGDIVKISGSASTAATCLATDAGYQEPEGSNLEYLNQPETRYPIARLAHTFLSNARVYSGFGSLVEISISSKDKINQALKVTLSAARDAKTIYGQGYENRIEYTKYLGNVISKGDRIVLPLHGSGKWTHFFSEVLEVEPSSNHGAGIINENTKFEIKEIENQSSFVKHSDVSRLVDLDRVVPIVKKVQIMDDLKMTVPFLEVYENGSKIFFYLTERIHKIESIAVDGHEMKRPRQIIDGLVMANMRISDDRGNSYLYMRAASHGSGTAFPSNSPDWEFFQTNTISYAFWPPIDKSVKELRIVVMEFFWQKHPMPPHLVPPPKLAERDSKEKTGITETNLPHIMTPMRSPGMTVLSGPWEFKISIN
ncbi:MAG: hypothetical protein KGI19_10450 [Thaumarchaeota archaeon]|nr:hypothetical protein [Nitrososphaerota archaeon]